MGPLEQTALRGGELLTGFLERFHEVTIRISAAQVPGRALGPLACLLNVHQGDVDLFEVALVHAESPKVVARLRELLDGTGLRVTAV